MPRFTTDTPVTDTPVTNHAVPDDGSVLPRRDPVAPDGGPGSRPLTIRTGAIIDGMDLRRHISDGDVAVVRRALLDYGVVFLRDQDIEPSHQIEFARRLGPLTRAHPTVPGGSEEPELFDLDSLAGVVVNYWHTDVTFVARPPTFSVLRAVVVPEVGGDTLWANTVTAYRDLRPDLRTLADGLRAVHTNGQDYGRSDVTALSTERRPELDDYRRKFVSTVYETEQPVVRVHPETGQPAILLGGFAQRLVGHPNSESVDIIRTIQSYVTRPENCVRWRWRPGDLAIWDNRSTQHYAVLDYGSERRRMQRVTTAGEPAVGLDGSPGRSLRGDDRQYHEVGR